VGGYPHLDWKCGIGLISAAGLGSVTYKQPALEVEGRENFTKSAAIFRVAVNPLFIKSEIQHFSLHLH
jgi:hypothetical protein